MNRKFLPEVSLPIVRFLEQMVSVVYENAVLKLLLPILLWTFVFSSSYPGLQEEEESLMMMKGFGVHLIRGNKKSSNNNNNAVMPTSNFIDGRG